MSDFDEVYERIQAIDLDVLQAEALESVSDKALMFQKQQLLRGETSKKGRIIPSYASLPFAKQKHKQNSAPGLWTPDLFKSGDMFNELDLVIGIPNDKSYSFISYVPYFNKLLKKYKFAFGLQKDSIEKTDATGKLIELYNKAIGL